MSDFSKIEISSKGQTFFALVDNEDYNRVKNFSWNIAKDDHRTYVISTMHMEKRKSTIRLHRLIMSFPEFGVVDHINGDGLDNRKSNLRVCSNSENIMNSQTRVDSKYGRGITKDGKFFRVVLRKQGKRYNFGRFNSLGDAKIAAQNAIKSLFNEYGRSK